MDRKQKKETGKDQDRISSGPTATDLLPPARFYFLKFPELPKIVPPSGTQHMSLFGGTFHI
jgi:hypothetical protein